jgi:hypothetical protein
MKNAHSECIAGCRKPTISQRRSYPFSWTFPFCHHQWGGVLDLHVIRLAQIFFERRPVRPAQA